MNAQQALEGLERLVADLKEAEEAREKTGLSLEGSTAYYLLKQDGVADALRVAEQIADAFGRYPHWRTSERQEQEVRVKLYKALMDAGVEKVVDGVTKLMKLLRRSALRREAWEPLEEAVPRDPFRAEVQAWARRLHVHPKEVHIRPMKRKWGSCSTTGRVTFDVGLLRGNAPKR